MMQREELAAIAASYVDAVATSSTIPAPLSARLEAERTLALNSIAHSLAILAGEVVGTPVPAEPVDKSPPTETEPRRNGSLWRGRNGRAVDEDDTAE